MERYAAVIVAGDGLQFRCVSPAAGLFASLVGTSDGQKGGSRLVFQRRRSLQDHRREALRRSRFHELLKNMREGRLQAHQRRAGVEEGRGAHEVRPQVDF